MTEKELFNFAIDHPPAEGDTYRSYTSKHRLSQDLLSLKIIALAHSLMAPAILSLLERRS